MHLKLFAKYNKNIRCKKILASLDKIFISIIIDFATDCELFN